MPFISAPEYHPGLFLKSGHLNTLYPYIFRKDPTISYRRIRVDTYDGDFIDLDTLFSDSKKLAILCHGLEGSAHSKYIKYTALLMKENGWDILAINYRGCSGQMNNKLQMYHSGFTEDLHMVVESFEKRYEHIGMVGFSLGGNILMKYLGEDKFPISNKIKGAVGISVPCDLSAGAKQIARWDNYIYEKRFLITLKSKIRIKKELFPEQIDMSKLKKTKSIWDFDEHYTGPIHGFKGAEDYYQKSSCKQFLGKISIPSLIINAKDDPFLPEESYPVEIAKKSEHLSFMMPDYGGHVGFSLSNSRYFWEEIMIDKFLSNPHSFLK